MIKFIPGHDGVLIDIASEDEILEAIEALSTLIGGFDVGHPVKEELDNILEEWG